MTESYSGVELGGPEPPPVPPAAGGAGLAMARPPGLDRWLLSTAVKEKGGGALTGLYLPFLCGSFVSFVFRPFLVLFP
jgi:hypothetical protein